MEPIERTCCVVTAWESLSDHKPQSCSGVILNSNPGIVICNSLIFSRFLNDKQGSSPLLASESDHRGILLPGSFTDNLKIRVKFSEQQRDLDTNRCAYGSSEPPETCATVAERRSSPHQHREAAAQLLMMTHCLEFRRAFLKVFKESDKWSFYGGGGVEEEEEGEDAEEMVRDFESLSWFAVLKVSGGLTRGGGGGGASNGETTTTTPWVRSSVLRKGRAVVACGSPFGAFCPELFMSTLSKGIVSNLAGEDNAVILTDARCVPGTEGGGLFVSSGRGGDDNKSYHLVGVIVSPLCWKSSEFIGLTLVCSLQMILRSVVRCVDVADPLREMRGAQLRTDFLAPLALESKTIPQPSPPATQKHPVVALIDSGQFWGSGILVGPRLVVTCRHVVNGKAVVTLRFSNKDRFHAVVGDVLFSTKESSPYDVAVVQLRDAPPEVVVPRLATSFKPGEDVVVVGYGALGQSCGPSLTCGVLSKAVCCLSQPVMLQTTCAVQAGASGGAVVRADSGELLGLVASNVRDAKVTYPHLNFSVPVSVLRPLLRGFALGGGAGVFRALDTTDPGVRRAWRLQAAHSKL